jgi:sulfur transfer protein SufE/stress-induced morphogen
VAGREGEAADLVSNRMKPFLIAGVPIAGIAGLALTATTTTTNAWTPPVVISRHGDTSTNSRSRRRSSTKTSLLSTTEEETTESIDVNTLNLTPQLRMMTDAFSSIPDERTRHKQLLYMASKLPNVDDTVRIPENKVPGCLSAVYVDCTATFQKVKTEVEDQQQWTVEYIGDSDGQLTKGLLALLIRGLNGHTPDEINAVNPTFIKYAKIAQSLTPGRNNGFLNMLNVMKQKAKEAVEREMMMESTTSLGKKSTEDGDKEGGVTTIVGSKIGEEGGGPMYTTILNTLITSLNPTSIQLVDDSHKHAGHAGSKGWGEDGESHFSLLIVSDKFDGLNLVKRHKLIYGLLGDVMPKIHALAIIARTPSEEKGE